MKKTFRFQKFFFENGPKLKGATNYVLGLGSITVLGYGFKDVIKPVVQPYFKKLQNIVGVVPNTDDNIRLNICDESDIVNRNSIDFIIEAVGKHLREKIVLVNITGVSGSGKTVLAKSFANKYYHQLDDVKPGVRKTVVLLKAETIDDDYHEFAERLGIAWKNVPQEDLKAKIEKQLSLREGWVIVIDGVDIQNQSKIEAYLPHLKSGGCVCLTSREPLTFPEAKYYEVRVNLNSNEHRMSYNELNALFDLTLGNSSPLYGINKELKVYLAKSVGYLPLPIKLLAIKVKNRLKTESFDKAVISVVNDFTTLAGSEFSQRQKIENSDADIIHRASQLLVLKDLDKKSFPLLSFITTVNPDHIDVDLVKMYLRWSEVELLLAINTLCNVGLLKNRADGIYESHSTLRDAFGQINAVSSDRVIDYENQKKSALVFKKLFSPDNRTKLQQEINTKLAPHIWHCLKFFKQHYQMAKEKKDVEYFLAVVYLLDTCANYFTSVISNNIGAYELLSDSKFLLEDWSQGAFSNVNSEKDFNDAELAILEMYARVLYSYGRIYLYTRDERILSKTDAETILLDAYNKISLTNKMLIRKGRKPLFEEVLYQTMGVLGLTIESQDEKRIRDAIVLYQSVLNDPKIYNDRGKDVIVKREMNSETNDTGVHIRMTCHNQIVLSYLKLCLSNHSESLFDRVQSYAHSYFWKVEKNPHENTDFYMLSLPHIFGDKENIHEGFLPLCYNATTPICLNGKLTLQKGFPEREAIYLATLGEVLLNNPHRNVLEDNGNAALVLNNNTKLDLTHSTNNRDIASLIFQRIVNMYEGKPPNFPLIQALNGLAEISKMNGNYESTLDYLEQSLVSQKKMSRTEHHEDVIRVIAIKNEIKQSLLWQQEFHDLTGEPYLGSVSKHL